MDVVLLVGRILFVLIFVTSGLAHFARRKEMTGYAASMGVPAAGLGVLVSGAMALAGGVMIAAGIWGDLGALLLVAFLIPTAFMMHPFWKVDDPQAKAGEQAQFMKNIALIGGSLVIFWLFNQVTDLPLTVTDPLISPL